MLLRSSALRPWYIKEFEAHGFQGKRVGNRLPGECIDRVNMYASCWICTKVANLRRLRRRRSRGHRLVRTWRRASFFRCLYCYNFE